MRDEAQPQDLGEYRGFAEVRLCAQSETESRARVQCGQTVHRPLRSERWTVEVQWHSYVRHMPLSTRDRKGRASPPVETEDLFTLVRLIARFARPRDLERIAQRAFDAARKASGDQGVPKATTICARLADRGGKPMPWREAERGPNRLGARLAGADNTGTVSRCIGLYMGNSYTEK